MQVIMAAVACKVVPPAFADAARAALIKAVETLEAGSEYKLARYSIVSSSFNDSKLELTLDLANGSEVTVAG